ALWRWMGMADTSVITTGLSLSSASQPATILPRGPLSVARPVAAGVLGLDPSPLEAPLRPHPRAALRRRIGQAVVFTVAVATGLAVLVATDVAPPVVLWALVGLGPLALGAAVVAYRALGHAIVGDYLVVRSGLLDRATTALLRPAVSTIVVRESLLQRRLGLKTVVAMTAAGEGAYEAPDLAADEAITFATEAAPGLLAPFFASAADAVAPAHSWRTS
ncbi:MAG: PH domain-containing protein, partial [Dehalococcoidia bacterium]